MKDRLDMLVLPFRRWWLIDTRARSWYGVGRDMILDDFPDGRLDIAR